MSTLAFIAAGAVLLLIVLAKIPGLEHTVRPLIDLVFSGIKFVAENSLSWGIWLFKLLFSSHLELLKHLLSPAEKLDPTVALEAKNQG